MLKVGDTVKVIGTTMVETRETEAITIGTLCKVTDTDTDEKFGQICEITTMFGNPVSYWYAEKDLEKGHIEWVKESEE